MYAHPQVLLKPCHGCVTLYAVFVSTHLAGVKALGDLDNRSKFFGNSSNLTAEVSLKQMLKFQLSLYNLM